MSTASSVYNLVTKTCYYLDSAFWLSAPMEQLLTPTQLRRYAFDDVRGKDMPERGKAWLEGLMKWIDSDGCYVIVTDSNQAFPFLADFPPYDPDSVEDDDGLEGNRS